MTRRFTERESPFGGRYWEDQDGNKIHEREGPFGGRYYEDTDGNKIQDLKGPFGGRYADDGEGHRTTEQQGLLGSTFEDREGHRTRVVEGLFGGRTVETDSPAPLFPERPAATERFQLPRIGTSGTSDDGPASLVGCLFLAVIAVVVLAIALYIGLPILVGVLLAKFVNRRYVEPQAERHRWRWAILPAAFAAGALPTNELVATGFGALQCSEPQSRSCAEYRQSPTPTVLGLHRWWIQNGQPMGQRPVVPNEAPEIAHLVARDPQARINLRKGPSATAESGGYGLVGDQVQLVDTAVGADGNSWSFVRFKGSGAEGWIRSDYVEPTANATSPAPAVRQGRLKVCPRRSWRC